jgi:threonine synthase
VSSDLMNYEYYLSCTKCSSSFEDTTGALTCPKCSGALDVIYDYGKILSDNKNSLPIDKKNRGIWRYSKLLPLPNRTRIVTLGEGETPFSRLTNIGTFLSMPNLCLKDETRNPTCSFKDRKSTVAVTKALERGYRNLVIESAGNAGASVAAYAAASGAMTVYVFLSHSTPKAKIAKILAYGGVAIRTNKDSSDIFTFVSRLCAKHHFLNVTAASRFNPYVKEGAKTAVFEIFQQLGGNLPDWIILPVGVGGNLSAYYKGMKELKLLGLIKDFPKLVGVQAKYCAPLVKAFEENLDPSNIPRIRNARTVAHSILDDWPPDGDQALKAIRATNGLAVSVSDKEILDSQKELASKEGLFVEPASASSLAALKKLLFGGKIDKKETIAIIATGHGLNQSEVILHTSALPPVSDLSLRKFEQRYLKS